MTSQLISRISLSLSVRVRVTLMSHDVTGMPSASPSTIERERERAERIESLFISNYIVNSIERFLSGCLSSHLALYLPLFNSKLNACISS